MTTPTPTTQHCRECERLARISELQAQLNPRAAFAGDIAQMLRTLKRVSYQHTCGVKRKEAA